MHKTSSFLTVLTVLLGLSTPAIADVSGRVTTDDGRPVENARVEAVDQEARTTTDRNGTFTLPGIDPPVLLLVSHPRFEDNAREIPAGTGQEGAELAVTLVAKQEIFEEIVVSADRGGESFAPVSVAATVVEPAVDGPPPSTLADAVTEVAGVSENGQGGLFQVYSVRGVSRQRILSLVAGARIVSERRAGASVSFIDPQLMGTVDVVRGPASSSYGSGALGGLIQVFPASFEGSWFSTGYESQGDERYLGAGWGDAGWSLGIVHRQADNAEAPDGSELATGFEQTSATLSKSWGQGPRQYQLLLIPSAGRDIQKSSTDFPDRPTIYPEENHLIARLAVTSDSGWQLNLFAHPNELDTVTTRPGVSRNEVHNEAVDFGLNWLQERDLGAKSSLRYGVEYFGRRNVSAVEIDTDLTGANPAERLNTLSDAQEDEVAAYGSVRWRLGSVALQAGGRFTWIDQSNTGFGSKDQSAGSGFIGATLPLANGFELASNIGTGLRFASLTERFFSGTTGRGGVIGNPDLDPERALNTDLGLRWYGKKTFLAGFVFRNEIDDYIERVEISPDLLTYINLDSGTIQGLELEGFYQPNPAWRLSWGGHSIEGRDQADNPLADVPTDEVYAGLRFETGPWIAQGKLALRQDKSDPGSGEKIIADAQLLSASVERKVMAGWALTLGGKNLLDEEYFRSADRKAPFASGRSLSVGLRWRPDGS